MANGDHGYLALCKHNRKFEKHSKLYANQKTVTSYCFEIFPLINEIDATKSHEVSFFCILLIFIDLKLLTIRLAHIIHKQTDTVHHSFTYSHT